MLRTALTAAPLAIALAAFACVSTPELPASRWAAADEELVASMDSGDEYVSRWGRARLDYGADADGPWIRATTHGDGEPDLIGLRARLDRPVDFTGRFVKVRVKVRDVAHLAGMEFRLSSDGLASSYFSFAVPLYADPEFNLLQDDDWLTLTWSFGSAQVTGEPDRAAIDSVGWILRDDSTGDASHRIVAYWGGLWAVAEPPRGILSFTFDDGYDEHFEYAAPLLSRYGFPATAYVMPDQVGTRGYMNLGQLHSLRDDYGWDVAAHHDRAFTGVSPELLEETIANIQSFLTEQGFGDGARHLAYPLGKQEPRTVLPAVRRHFATARVAGAGPETLPPGDPYRLRVLNVVRSTTPEEIRAAVRRAVLYHEWLILMFHYLVEDPQWPTHYATRDFARTVEIVKEEGIDVRTVSQVWKGLTGP